MEVENLQIAASDQKKFSRGRTTVMEQRRPRTKAALHKVAEENAARRKETDASGRR